ncbi:MAG: hypothetical protein R3F29_15035 [Planctomycetota bacterium]
MTAVAPDQPHAPTPAATCASARRLRLAAVLSLLLLPLCWLWPSAIGARTFVPYDVGQFPPASILADQDALQRARAGADLDVTEVPVWFVPELELAHEQLAAGRLPTWNPAARTGAPLHAHGLLGLCYPPNWLALASRDPASRLWLVAWSSLVIAGLGAFGLFRELRLGLLPAWLGAALFELSTPIAANAFFWMRLGSFVWLPAVLWALLRCAATGRGRPLPVLALGTAFAMTWLAGFPPFAATTTLFAGVTTLWLLALRWRAEGARAAWRLTLRLGVGFAFGACLAAPQVLPSLQFFPHSARPPVPEWRDIATQAFEPYGLLGYLMPSAFGDPSTSNLLSYAAAPMQLLLNTRSWQGAAALPNYNWTEYAVFVSTLGAVLAAFGLCCGRGERAWLMRTSLGLALGLGLFWPGLQLLFQLPVVQNVWPMRWPAAGTLFVTWAAALGAERLLDAKRRLPLLVGAASVLAGAVLWFATSLPQRWQHDDPEWAVAALEQHYAASRVAVQNHLSGVTAPESGPTTAQLDAVQRRLDAGFARFADQGRSGGWWLLACGVGLGALALLRAARARRVVLLAGAAAAIVQLIGAGSVSTHGSERAVPLETPVQQFLRDEADRLADGGGFTLVRGAMRPGLPDQLPPGVLRHRGVRDLNFYSHADRHTLEPLRRLIERHHGELGLDAGAGERIAGKGYLTASLPAHLLAHPFFDQLGVRFVLATEDLGAAPGIGERVGPQLKGRGEFFVYERPNALPRAYAVPAVEVLADDDAVLERLLDPTRAPRSAALMTSLDHVIHLPRVDTRGESDGPPRAVTFVRDEPTVIELDVAAGSEKWLVLADTFLPGWTAQVDDLRMPPIRCNHSQQLIRLPDTACRVRITYAAPGLTTGLTLAGIATLVAAMWWFRTRRTRPS